MPRDAPPEDPLLRAGRLVAAAVAGLLIFMFSVTAMATIFIPDSDAGGLVGVTGIIVPGLIGLIMFSLGFDRWLRRP